MAGVYIVIATASRIVAAASIHILQAQITILIAAICPIIATVVEASIRTPQAGQLVITANHILQVFPAGGKFKGLECFIT